MKLQQSSQDSGAFLVEMGVVVPIILLLIFGALECSRLFMDHHQAQFLSRIAGMDASRRCTSQGILDALDASPPNRSPLDQCIESVVRTTWNEAHAVMPELRIILSLFRFDGTSVSRTAIRAYRPNASGSGELYDATASGEYGSKFDAITIDSNFSAIKLTGNLVVAETFAPFSTRIPFVSQFFGGSGGHVQYSVSVH